MAARADRGFRDGLRGGDFSQLFRERLCVALIQWHEVDGAADARLQAVRRKARDGVDAGYSRSQLWPILAFAGAERGHDAEAGHDDNRAAGLITMSRHGIIFMS